MIYVASLIFHTFLRAYDGAHQRTRLRRLQLNIRGAAAEDRFVEGVQKTSAVIPGDLGRPGIERSTKTGLLDGILWNMEMYGQCMDDYLILSVESINYHR